LSDPDSLEGEARSAPDNVDKPGGEQRTVATAGSTGHK
jgi:hypothetical protein